MSVLSKALFVTNREVPIANAYVSIFRVGTSRLLKQVRSAADGSFLAKIIPGTYTILAVAQGFNSVTLGEVEVNRATELSYGFKLERSGDGNTLPEKRLDRNSSKWRIRAAQNQRSIYQNQSGTAPVNENELNQSAIEASITVAERSDETTKRSGQTVVETYFADSTDGSFTGVISPRFAGQRKFRNRRRRTDRNRQRAAKT
jgi:hypothetical protein